MHVLMLKSYIYIYMYIHTHTHLGKIHAFITFFFVLWQLRISVHPAKNSLVSVSCESPFLRKPSKVPFAASLVCMWTAWILSWCMYRVFCIVHYLDQPVHYIYIYNESVGHKYIYIYGALVGLNNKLPKYYLLKGNLCEPHCGHPWYTSSKKGALKFMQERRHWMNEWMNEWK
jgi:hypothetical protein